MFDGLLLGVDIGGTKVALAAADRDGGVIVQTRFPAEAERGPDWMLRRIVDESHGLLDPLPGRLLGIGVACGGPLDRLAGVILGPPNLPGWDNVSVTARLSEALDAPAWVDNDANVAALGESRFGAGRGVQDMVYVTVSTGIGGGVIVGGQVVHGVRDSGGEIGHQTLVPNGPRCGCGNDGCLEALASGPSIARRARQAAEADPVGAGRLVAAVGGDVSQITARHVADAARAGDLFAGRLWAEAMEYLGLGIGNVITILSPQRVVIGGGLSAAGDLLFEPVRATVRRRVRLVPTDQVDIVPAALGQDSPLRGAIALAMDGLRRD